MSTAMTLVGIVVAFVLWITITVTVWALVFAEGERRVPVQRE